MPLNASTLFAYLKLVKNAKLPPPSRINALLQLAKTCQLHHTTVSYEKQKEMTHGTNVRHPERREDSAAS